MFLTAAVDSTGEVLHDREFPAMAAGYDALAALLGQPGRGRMAGSIGDGSGRFRERAAGHRAGAEVAGQVLVTAGEPT